MLEQTKVSANTLPKLLLYHYQKYGNSKIALREKDLGIWKKYTWTDYYSIVERLTMAFLELGLQKNEKVAIIGENKPHIYWFELASLVCGGIVLGIFSDCTPPEVKYFLQHSDSHFVVCQDQEQVDKVLQIKDEILEVKRVIYWDKKGMWNYYDPLLMTMEEMMERGHKLAQGHPGLFEKMINETDGDDIAFFLYSSGTKGKPKAAMQTHYNVILMAEMMDKRYPVREKDETVSFFPIAWLGEQLFNFTYSLLKGFIVNFPESQETVQENIREVGPQTLNLNPRLWEENIKTIRAKMDNASWLNQLFFNAFLKVGYKVGDGKMQGKRIGSGWKLLNCLAEKIVFSPLRDRLGLRRIRLARTSSTSISPDVIRFFHAIGVSLVQLYGSSECGIATLHPLNQIKAETCGTPLDSYDVKISENGEILVRSPCLFKGYYKHPADMTNVVRDGWYHTGDFGKIDKDGHLIVMDRMEDLQKLAGGRLFSPQFAETRLRFSPYIKDALVVGREDRDYAVALVNIDYNNVGNWAEKNRISYTTFLDLSQKKEVIGLIKKELEDINKYLPEWAVIRKFMNLHKEFDPDEEEMTRTRKLRRDYVEEKYKELFDAIFNDKTQIDITASVTYRDGTKGKIGSSLSINLVS